MNRPNTIEGTPVITSTKYRTTLAKRELPPYSVRYSATPIPIGTEMMVASSTISREPRKKLPVGSWVKKLELIEPRPLSSR